MEILILKKTKHTCWTRHAIIHLLEVEVESDAPGVVVLLLLSVLNRTEPWLDWGQVI